MPDAPCICGHPKRAHIYDEGACRPGYVCPEGCDRYEPALRPGERLMSLPRKVPIANQSFLDHRVDGMDGLVDAIRSLTNEIAELRKVL